MSNYKFEDLCKLRQKWLEAARIYYLLPGDDTGVSDHEWDRNASILYSNRDKFPDCKILNDETYTGGSLYWVKRQMYIDALELYKST